MYNHLLDTFLKVADTGSFSAAAEELYVSSTAVIKKINNLESSYGITLFKRSNHGIELTEAGKMLYQDAKYIINYSKVALARIQNESQKDGDFTIHVGQSPNTPTCSLLNIWPRLVETYPEFRLDIISFDNSTERVNQMYENLGKEIDVYIGLFDPMMLHQRKCIGLRLSQEPLMVSVPIGHSLASKRRLHWSDLNGEHLMIAQEGRFVAYDSLRAELRHHPKIQVVDCETIRLSTFNICENRGYCLVIIDPWKNIHPLFRTLPISWSFSTPFGIVASQNPSPKVHMFLDAIAHIMGLNAEDMFFEPTNDAKRT